MNSYEEEEDSNSYRQYDIRDGIIFLIEVNEDIYKPLKELNGKSQVFEILSSINYLTQELVKTAPSTGIGIFFYNTSKQHKGFNVANVNRLFRLHELNLHDMQKLNNVIEDELEGLTTIESRYPPANEDIVDVNEVLKFILDEFRTNNTKSFNRKKLLWFTNNENPYKLNFKSDNDEVLVKARNTTSNYFNERIPIVPVFLNKYNQTSFETKFYEEIFLNTNFLTIKNKIMEFDNSNTLLAKQIKSNILRLKQVNRIQIACNLILSDGDKVAGNFGCAIRGYTLYNHEKPRTTNHIYVDGEDYKVVQIDSSMQVKDSEEKVEVPENDQLSYSERKSEVGIRKGFEFKYKDSEGYKHDSLYLTDDLFDFLKNYSFDHNFIPDGVESKLENDSDDFSGDDSWESNLQVNITTTPYLKLLGFRHFSKFQPFYNVSSPIFITYDSSNGANSQYGYSNLDETFKSLYLSCVKLERYAVLFGCTKRNALPNMYVLYPTNVVKSSLATRFPDGFLLVRLPYLDDIRSLPAYMLKQPYPQFNKKESSPNPKEIVDDFRKLIDVLKISNYNPGDFPNPSLNYFYDYLKSDLLGEEQSDKSIEKFDRAFTLIKQVYQHLHKSEYLDIFKLINDKLLEMGGQNSITEEEPPKKKQKIEEIDEMQLLKAWADGTMNQFNMNQLRAFVSKYKSSIKSASKKADLINNISEYLSSRRATN